MNKFIKKEKFYRKVIKKQEKSKLVLKYILNNVTIPFIIREKAYKELNLKFKNRVKLNRRCIITGRSRGIISKFKISRIVFKNFASKGYLPGIKKLSW